MTIRLCLNCLSTGANAVAVGPDKGGQRDSYRDTVDLCLECKAALLTGKFHVLATRHKVERTIRVDAQGER